MIDIRWDVFERCAEAILVADAQGIVQFLNRSAGKLLDHDPEEARGRFCWEISRMRTQHGACFCGPDCPVQSQARSGVLPSRR